MNDLRTGLAIVDPSQIGKNGLKQFQWPVSLEEIRSFRDCSIKELGGYLSEISQSDSEDSKLLKFLILRIFSEFLNMYNAQALISRPEKLSQNISLSTSTRIVAPLMRGQEPAMPSIVTELRKGPYVPRKLRWPVRLARSILVKDGFVRMRPINYVDDIITISTGGLINEHANLVDQRVHYCEVSRWLCDGHPLPASFDYEGGSLVKTITEIAADGFASHKLEMTPVLRSYLHSWLSQAFTYVRHYYRIGKASNKPLPKTLWTGSGAMLWARIFRQIVREGGGRVFGHEHATAAAHLQSPYKPMTEFENCDCYVTYTALQAQELSKRFDPTLMVQDQCPKFKIVKPADNTIVEYRANKDKLVSGEANKTIIYVGSLPDGETIGFKPRIGEMTLIDFQVRMVHLLIEQGYSVIFKPYPLVSNMYEQLFAQTDGVRVSSQSFETALLEADLVLMDTHLSTTFLTTIQSDLPAVLIDFGLDPMTDEANELLRRRCAVVIGEFDDNNRAQINPTHLQQALCVATDLKSTAFSQAYFGT